MAMTRVTQKHTHLALTSFNITQLIVLLCLVSVTIFTATAHMQEVSDPAATDLPIEDGGADED